MIAFTLNTANDHYVTDTLQKDGGPKAAAVKIHFRVF
jgi:hypothetical protein